MSSKGNNWQGREMLPKHDRNWEKKEGKLKKVGSEGDMGIAG